MGRERMAGQLRLNCHPGPKVNSVCPSVDVLFDSVAKLMGDKALGVILTGMGRDAVLDNIESINETLKRQ
jgi:two-component system chemotaxis response regulator CheB